MQGGICTKRFCKCILIVVTNKYILKTERDCRVKVLIEAITLLTLYTTQAGLVLNVVNCAIQQRQQTFASASPYLCIITLLRERVWLSVDRSEWHVRNNNHFHWEVYYWFVIRIRNIYYSIKIHLVIRFIWGNERFRLCKLWLWRWLGEGLSVLYV